MRLVNTLIAAVALAAAGASQAAPNLVVNGSFELGPLGLGSFDGWRTEFGDATTFVDSSGQTGPHPGQASAGLWSAYFGSLQSDGGATISQRLPTTAGLTYTLTFDLANDNGGSGALNGFSASAGGTVLRAFSNLGVQDYARQQASFVATASTTLLSFSGYNDSGYLQLDNLAVAVAAVPEPDSIAMIGAGLALLHIRWRSRRRVVNGNRAARTVP